jgi:hypothetical protein
MCFLPNWHVRIKTQTAIHIPDVDIYSIVLYHTVTNAQIPLPCQNTKQNLQPYPIGLRVYSREDTRIQEQKTNKPAFLQPVRDCLMHHQSHNSDKYYARWRSPSYPPSRAPSV